MAAWVLPMLRNLRKDNRQRQAVYSAISEVQPPSLNQARLTRLPISEPHPPTLSQASQPRLHNQLRATPSPASQPQPHSLHNQLRATCSPASQPRPQSLNNQAPPACSVALGRQQVLNRSSNRQHQPPCLVAWEPRRASLSSHRIQRGLYFPDLELQPASSSSQTLLANNKNKRSNRGGHSYNRLILRDDLPTSTIF